MKYIMVPVTSCLVRSCLLFIAQGGWTAEGSVVCTLTKEASLYYSQLFCALLASCTCNFLDVALVCTFPHSAENWSQQAIINNSTCGSLTISVEHFKYLMRVRAEATRLTILTGHQSLDLFLKPAGCPSDLNASAVRMHRAFFLHFLLFFLILTPYFDGTTERQSGAPLWEAFHPLQWTIPPDSGYGFTEISVRSDEVRLLDKRFSADCGQGSRWLLKDSNTHTHTFPLWVYVS